MSKIVKQQHFVTFYSPGTLFAETTTKPVKSWDVAAAIRMANGIEERHGATPYAFQFTTQGRGADDLNSKEIARSCRYFLGGRIETLAEVEARNDPKEEILRANMRCNNIKRIVINNNSWRSTQPFGADDVMLAFTPKVKVKS